MRSQPIILLVALAACGPRDEGTPGIVFDALPDPADWSMAGPGGPAATQTGLLEHCAYLLGGADDVQHHNLVSMHDGWLVLPWAPEYGGGGVSLYRFDDPCAPELVGEGWSDWMRETHTLAFSAIGGRTWLAVDYHEDTDAGPIGGIGIWDLTDPTAPVWVSKLALPGYYYPDAYLRVTLATFWQGPWLYAAGAGNGIYVIDVSDPTAPALVNQVTLDTPHLVGSVHVVGNVAMSSSAGLARTVMMDVSDPANPVPIAGGDFSTVDGNGDARAYYFANVGGRYGLFARKDNGGGVMVADLSDPAAPVAVGDFFADVGDGGYVFRHEDLLFVGESNYAEILDFTDPSAPALLDVVQLRGDFDTLTPIGNVAVGSVDEGADDGQSSAVIPWAIDPDARGPVLEWFVPGDGATLQATTSRIGLSFDEQIEAMSVHAGSFRVWDQHGAAVPGSFNTQENLVNFTPDDPLAPDTTYVVTIPAGGIADVSGNPVATETSWRFSTGAGIE